MIHERLPLRPLTPYGATKAAAEMLLSGYAGGYGMATCALRLTNVYGPGMAHKDSLVPRLMRAVRDGPDRQVYGDGASGATSSTSTTWWPGCSSRGERGTPVR